MFVNVRDNLTMQVLGWRQLIRDMPEEELPTVKSLFQQFEKELERLAKKDKRR